jgi:TRAP-type C4-dicarboxylate transport system substrate-binding protein
MKKLLLALLVVVVVAGVIFTGCSGNSSTTSSTSAPAPSSTTPAKSYYLRWAQFATAVLEDSQPVIVMADNINKRTNGQCKVELFWSDSLVPMFESMDAVRTGSAEMATFPFGPYGGVDPRFASSEMPLYYNTIEAQVEAQAALMPAYSGVFEEKFNQKALTVRSIIPLNPGNSKRPIKTVDDWKGLLVQTISPAMSQFIEKLGAVGAPASPIDVYELLQKGTVDATVQSLGKYYEAKLWEVCKYLTNAEFISASAVTTINMDTWNKLPKDIQDIILDEAKTAEAEINRLTLKIYYTYLDELNKNMEVYNLPKAEREKWQAALQPVVDEMYEKMGSFADQVKKTAEDANNKYPYPY